MPSASTRYIWPKRFVRSTSAQLAITCASCASSLPVTNSPPPANRLSILRWQQASATRVTSPGRSSVPSAPHLHSIANRYAMSVVSGLDGTNGTDGTDRTYSSFNSYQSYRSHKSHKSHFSHLSHLSHQHHRLKLNARRTSVESCRARRFFRHKSNFNSAGRGRKHSRAFSKLQRQIARAVIPGHSNSHPFSIPKIEGAAVIFIQKSLSVRPARHVQHQCPSSHFPGVWPRARSRPDA